MPAKANDWRAETLAQVRKIIRAADPAITESAKWKKPTNPAGVPTWERDGIICTGETYKTYVKLTFANGAALKDPSRLFNAGLDGNVRREIDIREGDKINEKALTALVRAAAVQRRGERPKETGGEKAKARLGCGRNIAFAQREKRLVDHFVDSHETSSTIGRSAAA